MSFDSFPNRPLVDPKIYAYTVSDKNYEGLMKIGFTNFDVRKRVKQQFNIKDAGSATSSPANSSTSTSTPSSPILKNNNCPAYINCMPTIGEARSCQVPPGCEGVTVIAY